MNLYKLKEQIEKTKKELIKCDYELFINTYANFRLRDDFRLKSELDKIIKENELKKLYIIYIIELLKNIKNFKFICMMELRSKGKN